MKINDMNLEQIRLRKTQISKRTNQEGLKLEDITKLEKELDSLETRESEIRTMGKKQIKLRKKAAEQESGAKILEKIDKKERNKMNETKKYGLESVEYRDGFMKTLMGKELSVEERAAFVHTTVNTEAVLPAELQNKIYTNMEEQHPILKDIQILRSGVAITIAKHTEIVAGDAKVVAEGAANDDEQNTFVDVTLVGKKFSKHVDFTYELEAMAIPAFISYLANEIGSRLGAAMADDVVRQIKADLAAANTIEAVTPGTLVLGDILKALGSLKGAGKVNVYANSSTFYNDLATLEGDNGRVSFIPNFAENISGQLLGKSIKEEDSMGDGEVLILDPKQFLWNEVKGITFETDRDIKKGVNTIAGHAIAGGTLTNDKAGSLVEVGTAL